jgi:hypothetical protein
MVKCLFFSQILRNDVWMDVLLDLEDDDMNGYTASGFFVAPGKALFFNLF